MNPSPLNCLLYICAAVAAGYIAGTADSSPVKRDTKPEHETCLPTDGWIAQIERTGDGGWACVMRSADGKHVKTFFYGEKK